MKYCPYCGAGLTDGTVLFCSECGKKMPEAQTTKADPKSVDEKKSWKGI